MLICRRCDFQRAKSGIVTGRTSVGMREHPGDGTDPRSTIRTSGRSIMTLYRRRTASCKASRRGSSGRRRGRRSSGPRGSGSNPTRSIGPGTAPSASRPTRRPPAARRRRSIPAGSRGGRPRRAAPPARRPRRRTGVDSATARAAASRPAHSGGVRQVERDCTDGQDQQAGRGRRRQQPARACPGQPIQRQAHPRRRGGRQHQQVVFVVQLRRQRRQRRQRRRGPSPARGRGPRRPTDQPEERQRRPRAA